MENEYQSKICIISISAIHIAVIQFIISQSKKCYSSLAPSHSYYSLYKHRQGLNLNINNESPPLTLHSFLRDLSLYILYQAITFLALFLEPSNGIRPSESHWIPTTYLFF